MVVFKKTKFKLLFAALFIVAVFFPLAFSEKPIGSSYESSFSLNNESSSYDLSSPSSSYFIQEEVTGAYARYQFVSSDTQTLESVSISEGATYNSSNIVNDGTNLITVEIIDTNAGVYSVSFYNLTPSTNYSIEYKYLDSSDPSNPVIETVAYDNLFTTTSWESNSVFELEVIESSYESVEISLLENAAKNSSIKNLSFTDPLDSSNNFVVDIDNLIATNPDDFFYIMTYEFFDPHFNYIISIDSSDGLKAGVSYQVEANYTSVDSVTIDSQPNLIYDEISDSYVPAIVELREFISIDEDGDNDISNNVFLNVVETGIGSNPDSRKYDYDVNLVLINSSTYSSEILNINFIDPDSGEERNFYNQSYVDSSTLVNPIPLNIEGKSYYFSLENIERSQNYTISVTYSNTSSTTKTSDLSFDTNSENWNGSFQGVDNSSINKPNFESSTERIYMTLTNPYSSVSNPTPIILDSRIVQVDVYGIFSNSSGEFETRSYIPYIDDLNNQEWLLYEDKGSETSVYTSLIDNYYVPFWFENGIENQEYEIHIYYSTDKNYNYNESIYHSSNDGLYNSQLAEVIKIDPVATENNSFAIIILVSASLFLFTALLVFIVVSLSKKDYDKAKKEFYIKSIESDNDENWKNFREESYDAVRRSSMKKEENKERKEK